MLYAAVSQDSYNITVGGRKRSYLHSSLDSMIVDFGGV